MDLAAGVVAASAGVVEPAACTCGLLFAVVVAWLANAVSVEAKATRASTVVKRFMIRNLPGRLRQYDELPVHGPTG